MGRTASRRGSAAVSALGFAVLGGAATAVALGLAGALVGFLTLNRPPARIYLGDAGAYLVGTTLAVLPALTDDPGRWSVWWAVPLLVAVPVADTAIAITRRLRSHQPILLGDRSHVYDQLVDRGMSISASTTTGICLQVLFTLFGLGATQLASGAALAVTIGVMLVAAWVATRSGFLGTPSG